MCIVFQLEFIPFPFFFHGSYIFISVFLVSNSFVLWDQGCSNNGHANTYLMQRAINPAESESKRDFPMEMKEKNKKTVMSPGKKQRTVSIKGKAPIIKWGSTRYGPRKAIGPVIRFEATRGEVEGGGQMRVLSGTRRLELCSPGQMLQTILFE